MLLIVAELVSKLAIELPRRYVVVFKASDSGSSWEMARNIRVMVAGNYAPLRATLAQLLFSWGYAVETASDGLEALGKILRSTPAVVISGLQMPRMGGMELLNGLRQRVSVISCIIISGDANAEKATEALRPGAYSFLEKPVEPERLQMDLRRCLEHSHQQSSVGESTGFARELRSGEEVAHIPANARCDSRQRKPAGERETFTGKSDVSGEEKPLTNSMTRAPLPLPDAAGRRQPVAHS